MTESQTNPYLHVLDLPAIARVARRHKALTVIDATLPAPYTIKPLEAGIDIVPHSATKSFGGHNELLAGGATAGHASSVIQRNCHASSIARISAGATTASSLGIFIPRSLPAGRSRSASSPAWTGLGTPSGPTRSRRSPRRQPRRAAPPAG